MSMRRLPRIDLVELACFPLPCVGELSEDDDEDDGDGDGKELDPGTFPPRIIVSETRHAKPIGKFSSKGSNSSLLSRSEAAINVARVTVIVCAAKKMKKAEDLVAKRIGMCGHAKHTATKRGKGKTHRLSLGMCLVAIE